MGFIHVTLNFLITLSTHLGLSALWQIYGLTGWYLTFLLDSWLLIILFRKYVEKNYKD